MALCDAVAENRIKTTKITTKMAPIIAAIFEANRLFLTFFAFVMVKLPSALSVIFHLPSLHFVYKIYIYLPYHNVFLLSI